MSLCERKWNLNFAVEGIDREAVYMPLAFRGLWTGIFAPAVSKPLSGISEICNDSSPWDCSCYRCGSGNVPNQPVREVFKKRVPYVLQRNGQGLCRWRKVLNSKFRGNIPPPACVLYGKLASIFYSNSFKQQSICTHLETSFE